MITGTIKLGAFDRYVCNLRAPRMQVTSTGHTALAALNNAWKHMGLPIETEHEKN